MTKIVHRLLMPPITSIDSLEASKDFEDYCTKNAFSWGIMDAKANLEKSTVKGWGKKAMKIYDEAYKKQILINLISGENKDENS